MGELLAAVQRDALDVPPRPPERCPWPPCRRCQPQSAPNSHRLRGDGRGLWGRRGLVALDRGVRFLLLMGFPAAAAGCSRQLRSPRGTAEGQRSAAGPRGLLPRAHGEPPLGRTHLPVYLASGWGSRGGALGRGGEAGPPRVPAAPTCLVLSHPTVQIDEWNRRPDAVVQVAQADVERVALDGGQQFGHAELLRHTRLCHAITYASCQGLTLRGRVRLLDAGTQHFNLRHLYVGASRATSSELLSVL